MREGIQNSSTPYSRACRREMEYPFGWIPRRFVVDGIMRILSTEELALYIFLAIVSDVCGISYYGDTRICGLTGLTPDVLVHARGILEKKGFITYKKPFYQVLKMPVCRQQGGKG